MPLAGKALESAILSNSVPQFSLASSGRDFWGSSPVVFRRALTGAGHGVLKTLELGTIAYRPNTPGKALKNVFINRIRKPVF
jgi:hypothetical protein